MTVAIASAPFDPHEALRAFCAGRADVGACASFIGLCRRAREGQTVHALELEHYPGFTEAEIGRIVNKVAVSFALADALVIHRTGEVAPGDAIVLAAALAPHRAGAFAAVEAMMDYLKTDAPFWKRELRDDGAHWIEPTEEDRRRRAAMDTP